MLGSARRRATPGGGGVGSAGATATCQACGTGTGAEWRGDRGQYLCPPCVANAPAARVAGSTAAPGAGGAFAGAGKAVAGFAGRVLIRILVRLAIVGVVALGVWILKLSGRIH